LTAGQCCYAAPENERLDAAVADHSLELPSESRMKQVRPGLGSAAAIEPKLVIGRKRRLNSGRRL